MKEVIHNILEEVSKSNTSIKGALEDKEVKEVVIQRLEKAFGDIEKVDPELVQLVADRVLKYHNSDIPIKQVTDFLPLIEWYGLSISEEKDKDYWNKDGKYFGIRMSEVIDMYLMGREMTPR